MKQRMRLHYMSESAYSRLTTMQSFRHSIRFAKHLTGGTVLVAIAF